MIGKKLLLVSAITIIFESAVLVRCVNDQTNNIPENQRVLTNNLNGKELRVVIADFPPTIEVLYDSTGHIIGYSGLLYHHLLFLSQKLNFTFKIFLAAENSIGVARNNTWTGVVGSVLRQEADLGLVPIATSIERYVAVDFCGLLGGDFTGILIKYPEAIVSFTSVIDVFSNEVWIGFLVSAIAVFGSSVLLNIITKRFFSMLADKVNVISTGTSVGWYLFGTIVSQGCYFPSRQLSQKLVAATWCLVAFVFVNIYCSNLTSYMSVTYQIPVINSIKDLAISASYKTLVLLGATQDIYLTSLEKNEELKIIAQQFKKCEDCRKLMSKDIVESVLEKNNYVGIIPLTLGHSFMLKYKSERNKCLLTMAKEKLVWRPMYSVVHKTSPYKEEINRESLWFHAAGMHGYWYGKYDKIPNQCYLRYNSNGVSTKTASNRIKLEQFYLPFLILFAGYLLALIQFVREQLFPSRDRCCEKFGW